MRQPRNDQIRIDREAPCHVDLATLPADAEYKGTVAVIVQDLALRTDNVRFLKEKALRAFLKDYWAFYHELWAYQEAPSVTERARLEVRYDALFATVTGYDALDDRIAKTRAKRSEVLQVFAHPELPLHNNAAELGCRTRVRWRDVSFGPRTAAGPRAWVWG